MTHEEMVRAITQLQGDRDTAIAGVSSFRKFQLETTHKIGFVYGATWFAGITGILVMAVLGWALSLVVPAARVVIEDYYHHHPEAQTAYAIDKNPFPNVNGATMQLSPHFSLEELTFSSTAVAQGIDNTAPVDIAEHLGILAAGLEKIRAIIGFPLHIDSGYRCPDLNRIVRGVPDSAHVTGFAADFICPQFGSPLDIVKTIVEYPQVRFDQVIQEGTWVHISFAPMMRQQVLTAHFVDGKAHYQEGVTA